MQLYYDSKKEWAVEVFDKVEVRAGEIRVPATVDRIIAKSQELVVSLEADHPIFTLIALRKSARIPLSAVGFVGRGL